MVTVHFEFPDRQAAKSALDSLVKKGVVTGELEIKSNEHGKWVMKIHSEREVKDSSIEKYGGRRLDA